jgi:hypothetical protein
VLLDRVADEKANRMTSKQLLPQAFWFRIATPCLHVVDIPRSADPARLLDLPEVHALPDFRDLEGQSGWAEVRVGWNAGGLGIMILANGIADQQLVRDRPEGFAVVNVWVDTRDTRDVSRATKFCHRFTARLEVTGSRRQLNVAVTQRPIARALADAPICRPQIIEARTELNRSAWALELFLPAQALNGFDPDTNRRLGFAYQIADQVHDDQFLGVGREFPLGENPSLWGTLELRD